MEAGYRGTQNFPTGLQWYAPETNFGVLPGEPVAMTRKIQMEYLSGERCPRCRIIVLTY